MGRSKLDLAHHVITPTPSCPSLSLLLLPGWAPPGSATSQPVSQTPAGPAPPAADE